jgi:hypothetical protein
MSHGDHGEKMMDPNKMELGQTSDFLWHRHEEEGRAVHHQTEDKGEVLHACSP